MIRNIKEFDYGIVEGVTDSSKWGKDILLICDEKDEFPYAEKCLEYFDNLPKEVENRLKKYLYRYFKDYKQYLDEGELSELNEENIFDYIGLKSIIVDKKCRQDIIEFHIEGSCDWEIEHGLEITISDDKILYVGPFEDNAPNSNGIKYYLEHYGYYKSDTDFNMNYVDKE